MRFCSPWLPFLTNSESSHGLLSTNQPQMAEVEKRMKVEALAEFNRKLVGILTAEQRQGLEKAAELQKAAEENAAKQGKGK